MKINTASFLISLSIILGQDSLQIFFHIVSYLLIFWLQADVVYVLEFLCYVGSFRIIIPDWILLQTFASTVPFHWGHISSRLTTESMYGGLLQFSNIVVSSIKLTCFYFQCERISISFPHSVKVDEEIVQTFRAGHGCSSKHMVSLIWTSLLTTSHKTLCNIVSIG